MAKKILDEVKQGWHQLINSLGELKQQVDEFEPDLDDFSPFPKKNGKADKPQLGKDIPQDW